MAFEHYIRSDGKDLRLGYTTGTCAALASAGAAEGLLTGKIPKTLDLITPKGIEVSAEPVFSVVEYGNLPQAMTEEMLRDPAGRRSAVEEGRDLPAAMPRLARCGIVKDAGDDQDVTDGLVIMARAEFDPHPESEEGIEIPRQNPDGDERNTECPRDRIRILGGEGVGRVTKPGLDQKVGEAAINSVPREMIRREVLRVCSEQGYEGGMKITIFVPGGEKAAEKTLNASLGIVGGISIIGTSGIVEPMSMKAYADSVRLRIRQTASSSEEAGKRAGTGGADRKNSGSPGSLILTPGNYGLSFLRRQGYDLMDIPVVVCSNFIGEALDEATADAFDRILLIGHAGKLVKVAAGIMNTHSSMADARAEIFTSHAAMAGASADTCRRLMGSVTSDGCIAVLREEGLAETVMRTILEKAQGYLDRRCKGAQCGMIIFSNEYGELGKTDRAAEILESWRGISH